MKGRRGFTLIELLVAVTIVALLAGLSVGSVQKVFEAARKTEEMNGARSLIIAYQLSASENNGNYMAGYDDSLSQMVLEDGRAIHGPAAQRYPHRLREYLSVELEDSILVGKVKSPVEVHDDYSVSLFPAFGINATFVGGNIDSQGDVANRADCITSVGNASSSVLVFASSQYESGNGSTIHGFHNLTPPRTDRRRWSASPWTSDSSPTAFGNVHARYSNKAICAFLDGSVRMQSIEELKDMRLWSRMAIEQNDPDYTIARQRGGSGRIR
ncbi:MAG: type II secretion system protein [Verrucomicrobiota bacterium]